MTRPTTAITTTRLRLRPLGLPAIDALWREDWESLETVTGLSWPRVAPPTLAPHLPEVRDGLEAGADPAWWIWSIADSEGECLGAAGFSGPPDRQGLVWIGYALYPSHRGSGFAAEAVRALVGWAFDHEEVPAVLATIAPGNRASTAVARRASMRFHARGARMDLYRVTRGQWEDAR